MSEPKDPEQLLADALRAQAVFAPQASPAAAPAPAPAPAAASPAPDAEPGTEAVPTSAINELPSAYGLLSGAGADSLERERAALDAASAPTAYSPLPPPRQSAQLPAYWILMLAVLLGLAAGSVVGLLTLV
ncbi:hypothetical protein [Amycolatopsis sp. lyj-23]|uniref:hypothetical protein n=1 Tax=Amycolatopsis sp. lyj-23 TaxID=2789283 RepID=UPI00397BBB34